MRRARVHLNENVIDILRKVTPKPYNIDGGRVKVAQAQGAVDKQPSADAETAQLLRFNYLRHAKKPWMEGYEAVRHARRSMMSDFLEAKRAGRVGPLSFEVIIAFFAVRGMDKRVENAMELARQSGVRSTRNMWLSLLSCYAALGRVHETLRTLRIIQKLKQDVSVRTLLPLLTVVVKRGMKERALTVAHGLLQIMGPKEEVYASLLSVLTKQDETATVFKEMTNCNVTLSDVHVAAGLQSCCATRDLSHGFRIMHLATTAGIPFTSSAWSTLGKIARLTGDLETVKHICNLAVSGTEPTGRLFTCLIQASLDKGDISSARMAYISASNWKLAGNLRVHSKTMQTQGMRCNTKDLIRTFDARPMGKYTVMTLHVFQWGLISTLIHNHPARAVVFMNYCKAVRNSDVALHMMTRHSHMLGGLGAGYLWRLTVTYNETTRKGKGSPPDLPIGVYWNIAMGAAGAVLRGAVGKAEVVVDMCRWLVDAGLEVVCCSLMDCLVLVCHATGRVEDLMTVVRRVVDCGVWWGAARHHLSFFIDMFRVRGDGDAVAKLRVVREELAAQDLALAMMRTPKTCDIVKDELAIIQNKAVSSDETLELPLTADTLEEVAAASSISDFLKALPSYEVAHNNHLPDRGLLLNRHTTPTTEDTHLMSGSLWMP